MVAVAGVEEFSRDSEKAPISVEATRETKTGHGHYVTVFNQQEPKFLLVRLDAFW